MNNAVDYALVTAKVLYRCARIAALLMAILIAAYVALAFMSPHLDAAMAPEAMKLHQQEVAAVEKQLTPGNCEGLNLRLTPAERQEAERFLTSLTQVVEGVNQPGTARLYGAAAQTQRDFKACP